MKKTYINPECIAHKVDTILPIARSNPHDEKPSNDKPDNQFVKGDGAWDDQW